MVVELKTLVLRAAMVRPTGRHIYTSAYQHKNVSTSPMLPAHTSRGVHPAERFHAPAVHVFPCPMWLHPLAVQSLAPVIT